MLPLHEQMPAHVDAEMGVFAKAGVSGGVPVTRTGCSFGS